ncbi:MAG: SPOR domain-containing protein [Steroidobacteraceae bacterium]
MDRRVKERLVGASILAALIVLVVPELLSGPVPVPASSRLPVSAPEPVRNVTVDLATSKAPEPPPVLDVPAASSAVASRTAASGAAAADVPVSVPPAPAPPPPAPRASSPPVEIAPSRPTLPTTATPAAAGHAWAVQLGSFVSRDNADKLARQLKAQGFGVYVLPGGSGPSPRYRVRIGPMPDRTAAAQTVAKLKSLGQVASLVPPGP